MTNRIIGIYDGVTDTYIEREATDLEQAEIDEREMESENHVTQAIATENANRLAKEKLLEKLGITAEEAALLLA